MCVFETMTKSSLRVKFSKVDVLKTSFCVLADKVIDNGVALEAAYHDSHQDPRRHTQDVFHVEFYGDASEWTLNSSLIPSE